MVIVIEKIINVSVKLGHKNTTATVEWTSGKSGSTGYLYYAQGEPNDDTLVYALLVVGPVNFAQNRFKVVVAGLNPALPYSFYVQTIGVTGVPMFDNEGHRITDNDGEPMYSGSNVVVAEMSDAQYLLDPISVSGVVPVSEGFPLGGPIQLGADVAINLMQGSIPDLGETLSDWYQNMCFEKVGKLLDGDTAFQVVETTTVIPFRGIIVPERPWELTLKPVAQRTWKFYKCFAETVLPLFTDDVVLWQGSQYRVVAVTDWTLYGYMEYSLAQDWVERGPINE